MSKETICVAYMGKAVDSGQMNVNMLAPALLSLKDLVDEANGILNNDGSFIQAFVKSDFEEGSFEIKLEIVRTLSEQIKLLFNTAKDYHVIDILAIVGFAHTATGYSLKDMLEWAKNRKITKVTKIDDENVRLYTETDIEKETYIDVSLAHFKLFKSSKVRKAFEGVVAPLKTEGVDGFEVRNKEDKSAITKIDKENVEFYDEPSDEYRITNENQNRMILKVSSVNFEKDLKWRFDNGDNKFFASIKDEVFLKAVLDGEIVFFNGMLIEADIKNEQVMYKNNIKVQYSIIKVYKVLNPKQIDLDLYNF